MAELPPLPPGAQEVPVLPPLPPGAQEVSTQPTVGENLQTAVNGIGDRLSGNRAQRAAAGPQEPLGSAWSSAAQTVGGALNQGVRGLAQGGLQVLGLPVDIAATVPKVNKWAATAIGLPEPLAEAIFRGPVSRGAEALQPYVGGDALAAIPDAANRVTADALGVTRPRETPDGALERFSNRVGKEVGGFALPAAGAAMGAVKAGAPALRKSAEEGSGLAKFLEPAAIDPGKFVAKEVRMGVGAGTGAATATAGMDPNDKGPAHSAADFAGALTGAGAVSAASRIGGPLVSTVQAVRGKPSVVDSHVRQNVADVILKRSEQLGPQYAAGEAVDAQPLIDKLRTPSAAEKVIPGFKSDIADRTGDTGLSGMVYNRSGGEGAAGYSADRAANTQAVDRAVNQNAPTGSPGDLRGVLEVERNRVQTDANVFTANARDDFEAAMQRLQPGTTEASAQGAGARGALRDAEERARALEDAAWQPVRGGQADIAPLAGRFDQITNGLTAAERTVLPQNLTGIPNQLAAAAEGGALPLREVTALRSRFSTAIREANSNNDPDMARILNQYVDGIDAHLAAAMPQEQRQAYETARRISREVNDRFNRPGTAVAESLRERQGIPTVPDSGVMPKFMQTDQGNLGSFNSLMREAGGDPRVESSVRDFVLTEARQQRLLENPRALDQYIADRGAVFEQFPTLRDELGSAAGLRRALDARVGRETALARDLGTAETRGAGPVGQYLHFGPENAASSWNTIMGNPKPADALGQVLDFAGNAPEAVQGARASFWEQLQKAGRSKGETTLGVDGAQPWRPQAVKAFLNDPKNAAVAQRLYRDDPEQLTNLTKIFDALSGSGLSQRAKATNSSGTAQLSRKEAYDPALSASSLASRGRSVQRGQLSAPIALIDIMATYARRMAVKSRDASFQILTDKAARDPEVAAALLQEFNPANMAALKRAAKLWPANEASTFLRMLDPQDPVIDAATRKEPMNGR